MTWVTDFPFIKSSKDYYDEVHRKLNPIVAPLVLNVSQRLMASLLKNKPVSNEVRYGWS